MSLQLIVRGEGTDGICRDRVGRYGTTATTVPYRKISLRGCRCCRVERQQSSQKLSKCFHSDHQYDVPAILRKVGPGTTYHWYKFVALNNYCSSSSVYGLLSTLYLDNRFRESRNMDVTHKSNGHRAYIDIITDEHAAGGEFRL